MVATFKFKLVSVVILGVLFGTRQAGAQSAPSAMVHGVSAIVPLVVRLDVRSGMADGIPVVWTRSNDPSWDRKVVGELVEGGVLTVPTGAAGRGGAQALEGMVEATPTLYRFTAAAP